jgi:Tfp pilus assembly protein PilN
MHTIKQINLLPWRDQQCKREKLIFILIFSGIFIFGFLLLFLSNVLITYQIQQLSVYKDELTEQIELSVKKLRQLKIQSEKIQLIRQLVAINHMQLARISLVLEDVISFMPIGIVIKNISYKTPYLSLLGYTQSEKSFWELVEKMNKKYQARFAWNYPKKMQQAFVFTITVSLEKQKQYDGKNTASVLSNL